jgi:hypothetical protein
MQESRFQEEGFVDGCELCKNSNSNPAESKGDKGIKSKRREANIVNVFKDRAPQKLSS